MAGGQAKHRPGGTARASSPNQPREAQQQRRGLDDHGLSHRWPHPQPVSDSGSETPQRAASDRPALACISHQYPTARAYAHESARLSSVGHPRRTSSTPAVPSVGKPRISKHLRPLATGLGEKRRLAPRPQKGRINRHNSGQSSPYHCPDLYPGSPCPR